MNKLNKPPLQAIHVNHFNIFTFLLLVIQVSCMQMLLTSLVDIWEEYLWINPGLLRVTELAFLHLPPIVI